MSKVPCRSHAHTVAFLTAGLAILPFNLAQAAPADRTGTSDPDAQPPIQRPTAALHGEASTQSAAAPDDEQPPAPELAEDAAIDAATDPEIDPGLLEAEPRQPGPARRPPPPTARPQTVDPDAEDAALRARYEAAYRPPDNPGRASFVVRTLFATAGGNGSVGGRMGGLQVDLGQNFNRIGYAITGQAWGGRVFLSDETQAEMNAMFGVGPTLSLGRLALQGQGFIDLRVGYDFFYGIVNRRRDDTTVVAPTTDPDIQLVQTENLIPHGPRAQLNMGFILRQSQRGFFHGLGVSAGYQGLVHSFRGDLPYTHMLTIGLSYWLG